MILLFYIFISFSHAQAASIHYNYKYSPLGSKYDNGYPKSKCQQVIQIFKKKYDPIIAAIGGTFHIQDGWTDGAVNMWAFRTGDEYTLEIPGGMSRYYLINEEAFIISICHELGHLLGGAPMKYHISFEGQADYYATNACVKKMLKEIKPYRQLLSHPDVETRCSNEVCARALKGALSLTSYYAELEKVSAPKFTSPSQKVVSETQRSHPPAQCRLDTLYAGFIQKERPACWFVN